MNCYYKDHIKDFLIKDADAILGTLACKGGNDPGQMDAWCGEISIMRDILYPYRDENAEVLFEYTIPRLAKRVDIVLLLKGLIFVLEFKVGEKEFHQADIEQVMDYALDLKNFHKESHKRTIVPILIATEAKDKSTDLRMSVYHDSIYNPLLIDANGLGQLIANIVEREHTAIFSVEDIDRWHKSRYEPTPTIIEAASALYLNHTVEEITRSDASGE